MDLLDSTAGHDVAALRAVLSISQSVAGVQRFEDALEVIAEQTLVALNADSFSISRWEPRRGVLRTLINVGHLGPGEERWPDNEEYTLADHPFVGELLERGRPYTGSIDDPDLHAPSAALLRRLGKESELAVPVRFESELWGELWATGNRGRRFGGEEMRLLAAIGAQLSVAIGRAELFSEVSRYAYEDPLTGLANRRRLDERLAELGDADGVPVLLVGDLDGLKTINDRDGHPAGDALLRGVADVLKDVATAYDRAVVARLGGDEFCVLLPDGPLTRAADFARVASGRIARELGSGVSLCWGAATWDAGIRAGSQLVAAADAALLDAKRLGPGRLRLGAPAEPGRVHGAPRRRDHGSAGRNHSRDLVARVVELFDECLPPTTVAGLELLAHELTVAAGAVGWTISATTDDFSGVRTVAGIASMLDPVSGLRALNLAPDEVYLLADYPATADAIARGATFMAGVELEGSDPGELAVLDEFGYRAMLGVGLFDGQRGYLIEIYSDDGHAELAALAPHARVLARYCALDAIGRLRFPGET